jgi:hypothetical protein
VQKERLDGLVYLGLASEVSAFRSQRAPFLRGQPTPDAETFSRRDRELEARLTYCAQRADGFRFVGFLLGRRKENLNR